MVSGNDAGGQLKPDEDSGGRTDAEEGPDDQDPSFEDSLNTLQQAAKKANEATIQFYHSSLNWIRNSHPFVQLSVAAITWFGGNWIYTQVSPVVIQNFEMLVLHLDIYDTMPQFLDGGPILTDLQLFGMFLGVVVGQNRIQTQKLKKMETKLATVEEDLIATDGGVEDESATGGGAVGGAIAGGFAGLSLGPGGIAAGALVGYLIGERVDHRVKRKNNEFPNR